MDLVIAGATNLHFDKESIKGIVSRVSVRGLVSIVSVRDIRVQTAKIVTALSSSSIKTKS